MDLLKTVNLHQHHIVTEDPTQKLSSMLVCFLIFESFSFCYYLWTTLPSSSSCWSRGSDFSRTIPGPYHTIPGSGSLHQLPRQHLVLRCEPQHHLLSEVQLSENGTQESFTAFVEWVLVRNRSPFTVGLEGDLASPTLDPESSLTSNSPARSISQSPP